MKLKPTVYVYHAFIDKCHEKAQNYKESSTVHINMWNVYPWCKMDNANKVQLSVMMRVAEECI